MTSKNSGPFDYNFPVITWNQNGVNEPPPTDLFGGIFHCLPVVTVNISVLHGR